MVNQVCCTLAELGQVEIVPVTSSLSENSRVWNELIGWRVAARDGSIAGPSVYRTSEPCIMAEVVDLRGEESSCDGNHAASNDEHRAIPCGDGRKGSHLRKTISPVGIPRQAVRIRR